MSEIKAIETQYKNYRFRSRLEARWAIFMDNLEVEWEYEPEGYTMPSGRYLPDFWLPQKKIYLEIKPPVFNVEPLPIYLGGKMNPRWRAGLKLRGHMMIGPDEDSNHGPGLHGAASGDAVSPDSIHEECLNAIATSKVFFAWINTNDAYGTLVELGFAKGMGLATYVAFADGLRYDQSRLSQTSRFFDSDNHGGDTTLHDLWFAERMAGHSGFFESAQEAFDSWFYRIESDEEKKCQELSTQGRDVLMVCGDPLDSRGIKYRNGERILMGLVWPQFECGAIEFERAAKVARGARFEHGETPQAKSRS